MTTPIYINAKITTKEFIKKSKKIHGGLFNYSELVYLGSIAKVEIICKFHGSFWQFPHNHLKGSGCKQCAIKAEAERRAKKVGSTFELRSNKIHENKYYYHNVVYINNKSKVDIICPTHGSFLQAPGNHLKGMGCPSCAIRKYSKLAIKWLTSISPDIQHAENGGEYRIPFTRYSVDGYHADSNTVYEFHGDCFHGNPNRFNDDDNCHPYWRDIPASQLYQKTIERENEIKSLGYNLVVMWEKEYRSIHPL